MCGIAGMISVNGVDEQRVKKMTNAVSHRGPDGEGVWINNAGNVGLGHRRLSIIDLSNAGSQPMLSHDKRYSLTFNGEIYNYLELKNDLKKKGFQFYSNSDTEVLLNLYAYKGVKCLDDIDGMFSFCIWDELKKELFCARDRFGEKPFFYNLIPGKQFAFASEIKSLWSIGVDASLNYKMVSRYFNDNYYLINPHNLSETFYNNIQRLEPAHYLVVNEKCEVKKTKYWSISTEQHDTTISFSNATEKFNDLFFKSISRRLRSDVPVGSSLSGGLDSSSIVCAINEINKKGRIQQSTFSARFPGFVKDEGKYIDIVLEQNNIKGHFTFPDHNAFIEELPDFLYHQEEPVASSSQFIQWEVMKLAKQNGVTVLLDGQGADETLTGYEHYFIHYFNELKHANAEKLPAELSAYNHLHNRQLSATDLSLNAVAKQPSEVKFRKGILNSRSLKKTWYHLKHKDALFTPDFLSYIFPDNEERYLPEPSSLNESLYNDTFGGKLEVLLRYADRNSMAFSREVRLPFLFHELVEFMFSLPSEFKINNGWSKYILRKSMEPLLPREICWRTDKIGYEAPQHDWFTMPYMQQLVTASEGELEKAGILNKKRKDTSKRFQWQTVIVANMLKTRNILQN